TTLTPADVDTMRGSLRWMLYSPQRCNSSGVSTGARRMAASVHGVSSVDRLIEILTPDQEMCGPALLRGRGHNSVPWRISKGHSVHTHQNSLVNLILTIYLARTKLASTQQPVSA